MTDASLLARLQAAQTEYFKARQENANKDVISQSLLRVNPTLKTIHAPRNTLNTAERNLLEPISRRDVLSSQLLKVSRRHTALQEELAALQVQTLGMSDCWVGGLTIETMRENREIYADLEKISQEYERDRMAALSPAEREQLATYTRLVARADSDLKRRLRDSVCSGRLLGMCCRD